MKGFECLDSERRTSDRLWGTCTFHGRVCGQLLIQSELHLPKEGFPACNAYRDWQLGFNVGAGNLRLLSEIVLDIIEISKERNAL